MRGAVVGGVLRVAWMSLALAAKPLLARPPTTIFAFASTPPITTDTDADGLSDTWENLHGLDPASPADAALDVDGDGQNALAESMNDSDPWCADSNHDSLPDGTTPGASGDADRDGIPDAWEFTWLGRTDLDAGADSDGDGIALLTEWQQGLHPTAPDGADAQNQTQLIVHRPNP